MERLAAHAEQGRLVVFVGAGVSVAPPACLPSWWQIDQAVVEALAAQVEDAAGVGGAREHAAAVVARQRAERFPPEYQAEVIVGRLREDYFEVLRCLDGDEPNGSHLALAALARAGSVRAIVTTNFDRVLEAAFARAAAPLDVHFRAEHFEGLAADLARLSRPGAPCQLLKIHGSAEDPSSLVDTLSQRKRGLPSATTGCIRHLLRFGHWLFLGSSGADLEADPGYLHLRGDRDEARGFTWLVQEGKEPLSAVARTRELYGDKARILFGELPVWVEELGRRLAGGDLPASARLSVAEIAARRAAVALRVDRHARAWAAERGGRRCAVVLASLLEAVGEPGRAIELLSAVHARTPAEERATGTFAMVAEELGSLYRQRGENERSLEHFRAALRLFEDLGAEQPAIGVRNNMALTLAAQGRYGEALEHFQAARAFAAGRGAREDEAVALHNVALVHGSRGSYREALAMYEEELAIVTELGDEHGRAIVLNSIGDTLARLDRFDEALTRLEESMAILERLGDDHAHARALGNVATVHQMRGEYPEALRVYGEARAIFARMDDAESEIVTLLNIAGIRQDQGRLDEALELAERAGECAVAAGLEPLRARALTSAGAFLRALGELERATGCLEEALALRTEAADARGRSDTLNELGILLRERGETGRAEPALEEALRIRTELGLERARTETLNNLAMLAGDRGDHARAERLLSETLETLERLGLEGRVATAAFNLGNTCLALRAFDRAAHLFARALVGVERIGNVQRAADVRLALAWTRGLQGRPGEALEWFEEAERRSSSAEERLGIAARIQALADVYEANGHGDVAWTLAAQAQRLQGEAGSAPG